MAIKEEIRMNDLTETILEATKEYDMKKGLVHYNCTYDQEVTERDMAQIVFMVLDTAGHLGLDSNEVLKIAFEQLLNDVDVDSIDFIKEYE